MTKFKFTKEIELEICQKYSNGLNSYELGREYNCTDCTIRNILKRNNIEIRDGKLFNSEIELEICQKYDEGLNSTQLGKLYNCSVSKICTILKKNNIQVRKQSETHRKYHLDQSFFDVMDRVTTVQ